MTYQWLQLLAMAVAHGVVDAAASVLPVLLPVIREEFDLTLAQSVRLITAFGFVCNWMQVACGHLRSTKKRPLFVPLGLLLAGSMGLIGCLPALHRMFQSPQVDLSVLCGLMVVVAVGVAFLHPEGLRAVHRLRMIPGSVRTAIFLAGGSVGISGGGILSAVLVERWGLEGMWVFGVAPVVLMVLLYALRIRLPLEGQGDRADRRMLLHNTRADQPFALVLLLAIPMGLATTVIFNLLPTRLNEIAGFSVSYGGLANMLLGGGGAVGSFFWAVWARRKGDLWCTVVALLWGIPFMVLYLWWIDRWHAIWLLIPVGFGSMGSFPLIVSMARYARGLTLGGRMSLVVGGCWGVASLALIPVGVLAQKYSLQAVLNWVWVGYLLSVVIGVGMMRKR